MQKKEETEIKETEDALQTNDQHTSAADEKTVSPNHERKDVDNADEQEGSRKDPTNRWLRTRKSDYDLPAAKRHKGELKDKWVGLSSEVFFPKETQITFCD